MSRRPGVPSPLTAGPALIQRPLFHDPEFAALPASPDARLVVDGVAESADNGPLPFVVLDKRDARVYVVRGEWPFSSPPARCCSVAAPGDDTVEGIGMRPIAQVRPEERTTPAGRFVSEPGKNASHEDVVWVDYADAVSMHRVRPIDPKERRLERLARPTRRSGAFPTAASTCRWSSSSHDRLAVARPASGRHLRAARNEGRAAGVRRPVRLETEDRRHGRSRRPARALNPARVAAHRPACRVREKSRNSGESRVESCFAPGQQSSGSARQVAEPGGRFAHRRHGGSASQCRVEANGCWSQPVHSCGSR